MLFFFASLPLFLQFIGEFLFMCRVCCELVRRNLYEQITNCVPTYYFTCWFNFLDLFFV